MITKEIQIEDLVTEYPFSVRYLSQHGIRCIACGEPIWGTLEEAIKEKGFNEIKMNQFLSELNAMAETISK